MRTERHDIVSDPRVLHAMAGAEVGGAEAFFERLAVALEEAGLTQHCVIRNNAARRAVLAAAEIPVTELSFGGFFDFTTGPRLRRAIATFQPEIVLSWMSRATDFVPHGTPKEKGFVHVGRLGGYYDLKHYRHCDHLVCNTEDLCAYAMRGGFPRDRVHYVPNFVHAERAMPISPATFGTPCDLPVVVAAGRLHPNKAFDVLLKAFAQVPRAHLWLAGSGPLDSTLKALAGSLGIADRVHFLGWRQDVASLIAASAALVCPSRQEPLGNVVLEGWAQGTAVVAAAAAGPASLIKDGESGLLVPIDDPDALAAALNRVLADAALRTRLADGGRAAFEAGFTKDAVVKRYRELFETIRPSAGAVSAKVP
jgi:glycosyltransferase involved in cell wall biosynthesis